MVGEISAFLEQPVHIWSGGIADDFLVGMIFLHHDNNMIRSSIDDCQVLPVPILGYAWLE